jgi:hypothetical protein
VPKQPLKRQIKQLHPSCSSGELKGLSNKGIRRVEAILAFFSQVWMRPQPALLPAAPCTITSRRPIPATHGVERAGAGAAGGRPGAFARLENRVSRLAHVAGNWHRESKGAPSFFWILARRRG